VPREYQNDKFGDLIQDPHIQLKQNDPLLVTLAACHTLTRIEGKVLRIFYQVFLLLLYL